MLGIPPRRGGESLVLNLVLASCRSAALTRAKTSMARNAWTFLPTLRLVSIFRLVSSFSAARAVFADTPYACATRSTVSIGCEISDDNKRAVKESVRTLRSELLEHENFSFHSVCNSLMSSNSRCASSAAISAAVRNVSTHAASAVSQHLVSTVELRVSSSRARKALSPARYLSDHVAKTMLSGRIGDGHKPLLCRIV